MPSKTGSEGIYFVVRLPECWRLVAFRYDTNPENDHSGNWETHVTPMLAKAWALQLFGETGGGDRFKREQRMKAELDLYYDGFPRGRVTWSREQNRFTIFHGNNLKSAMKVSRAGIEKAFGITGQADWQFDDHEQCTEISAEAIRLILRIKERWKILITDNEN